MEKLPTSIAMPPKIKEVKIYFIQKGVDEKEAGKFFKFYEKKQWKSERGNPFKGWKPIAWRWIREVLSSKPWLFNRKIR